MKMNNNLPHNITIRREAPADYRRVENLVRESFWNVYRPGCYEHCLLHVLRDHPDFVNELDLVIEKDGELIGQIAFVKAKITADDNRIIPILTLGPICISPEYARRGYGKLLLDYSLERAREYGAVAVCLEGNINFYSKCGFRFASEIGIRYHGLPEGADASFFLCNELVSGIFDSVTGEYATPAAYFVDPAEIDKFDAEFPKKEKLKLPTQLFE